MALKMNLIALLLISFQIASPSEQPAKYAVADLQARPVPSSDQGFFCRYKIQPFLQVAADLQKLDEQKRVDKLTEWATIDSLGEPTIILCRMLIENKDGSPLRRPLLGGPAFLLSGGIKDFPDEPWLFHENIPFFVVRGYALGGVPEHPVQYLKHAIEVGRWRDISYDTLPQEKLREIAARLIAKHNVRNADQYPRPEWFGKWIESQLGPPKPPQREVP